MSRTIHVTQGEVAYVGGTVTAANGANISTDTIVMGLGSITTPPARGAGVAPDSDTAGTTTASRVVKMLINSSTTLTTGRVYVWAWIADNPEVSPLRLDGGFIIV